MTQEDLMMVVATNIASVTSRTSMSAIIVVGVVRCLRSFYRFGAIEAVTKLCSLFRCIERLAGS